MGEEEGDVLAAEILCIRKTPALNRFLFFLNDCGTTGTVDHSELEEMKSLMPKEEKHAFHLILSAFLDDEQFQEILLSERAEEIFANVAFIMDSIEETERFSKELYVDIVVGLELIEHCVCMILVDPRLEIMKKVAESLTSRLVEEKVAMNLSLDLFDIVMTSFVKLSRMQDEEHAMFYSNCLKKIVQCFVMLQLSDVEKCYKFATLFRLIGISILHKEDYQNSDEVSVLLEEWEFDKSIPLMMSASTKIYETLLNTKANLWIQKRLDNQVVVILDSFLSQTIVDKSDENLEKCVVVSSRKLALSCYIGGCAYLIKMIMERRCDSLEAIEIPNTLSCIADFVKEKPKMKQDEVIGDVQDFYNYCHRMEQYGCVDIYKRDWTTKFLTFSTDEIIGTLEGNAIIESFIIGAEYDLVMECMKKVCDADRIVLDESRKELIFRIVTQERKSKHENQDFIKELFRDGVNSKLATENFKGELHILSLQLGNIEFEKDATKLSKHELTVIRLCLQDPIVAITKILDQSVRTEHFRALGFASPFFSLPLPKKCEEMPEETDLPQTLIVNCFYKFLKHFPEYPHSLYDSLSNWMSILISQDVLTKSDMFVVLRFQILKLLSANKVALSIVVGLVCLLETLVKLVSEDSLIREISKFVVNLNRFFCLYTNSKTFQNAVKTKDILVRILNHLKTNFDGFQPEITKSTEEEIEDMSLHDQGIIYVRCDQFRPIIKKFFETGRDDLSIKDFIQKSVLPWVLNSNEEEWSSLMELLFNITMSPSSKLYRVKNVNKMLLLNEMVLLMYVTCMECQCIDAFLHTVRFYSSAVEILQSSFGEDEWYTLFDTLFTIGAEMSKSQDKHKSKISKFHKEVAGLHKLLSYVLSKIEDFTQSTVSVENCDKLISKLESFSVRDVKCEPVRWLITEKLKQIHSSCSA